MIFNIKEQVKKVMEEIERSISKGMIFSLEDLTSYRVAKNSSNFQSFNTVVKVEVLKIANVYTNGKYKKK